MKIVKSNPCWRRVENYVKHHPKMLIRVFNIMTATYPNAIEETSISADSILNIVKIQWLRNEHHYLDNFLLKFKSYRSHYEIYDELQVLEKQKFNLFWVRYTVFQSGASVEDTLDLAIRMMNQAILRQRYFASREYWGGLFMISIANAVSFLAEAHSVTFPWKLVSMKKLQFAALLRSEGFLDIEDVTYETEIKEWLQREIGANDSCETLSKLYLDPSKKFFRFCQSVGVDEGNFKVLEETPEIHAQWKRRVEKKIHFLDSFLSSKLIRIVKRGVLMAELNALCRDDAELNARIRANAKEYFESCGSGIRFDDFIWGYILFLGSVKELSDH